MRRAAALRVHPEIAWRMRVGERCARWHTGFRRSGAHALGPPGRPPGEVQPVKRVAVGHLRRRRDRGAVVALDQAAQAGPSGVVAVQAQPRRHRLRARHPFRRLFGIAWMFIENHGSVDSGAGNCRHCLLALLFIQLRVISCQLSQRLAASKDRPTIIIIILSES